MAARASKGDMVHLFKIPPPVPRTERKTGRGGQERADKRERQEKRNHPMVSGITDMAGSILLQVRHEFMTERTDKQRLEQR